MKVLDLAVGTYVQHAYASDTSTWDPNTTRDLAGQTTPDSIGGLAGWLIFGDAKSLWARWFLESLGDPNTYQNNSKSYPYLFNQVLESVKGLADGLPPDEQQELAKSFTKILWREVERLVRPPRVPVDRESRLVLSDLFPRCWICGALFPDWARSKFRRTELSPAVQTGLTFIDYFRPRGLTARELDVEVEHVVPHAGGGRDDLDNLRLACGWCNRAKGPRTLLYDAEATPRSLQHPALGMVSVPQPFWVVRLLAMRPRCEYDRGCDLRTTNAELTVALKRPGGSPNPTNLFVVCQEHDPMAATRLINRANFRLGRF